MVKVTCNCTTCWSSVDGSLLHSTTLSCTLPLAYLLIVLFLSAFIDCYAGFATRLWRNVRPTSQRWAVNPAALLLQPPTPADDDDDFLDFLQDEIYCYIFVFVLQSITTTITLCIISADSTMTSPLLCDTAYLSVSWLELLYDLFLPVIQPQAV